MTIPLANAIFGDELEISDFVKPKLNNKNTFNLYVGCLYINISDICIIYKKCSCYKND